MEHITYNAESIDFRSKVVLRLVNNNYKMNRIILNYSHTSRDITYIGVTPDITYGEIIGDDNAISREIELDLNLITAKNLVIIINDFENLRFPIINTNETYFDDDVEHPYLYIGLEVEPEVISKSTKLHTIDPILQYYKKMYPVYSIESWSTIKNEVSYSGKINKITFDSVSRKFMVYFDSGMIYLFDDYPFSTNSSTQIQHFNHITPPDIHWIIDNANDDMIFITKMLIQSATYAAIQFNSIEELFNTINDNSGNNSKKYNERFNVQFIKLNIPHLNRELVIDLNSRNIPFSNLILELNSTYIKTFPIPWRTKYKNTEFDKIDIVLFIADSESSYAYSYDNSSHFEIEYNTKVDLHCQIINELTIPFNRT